jgi:uncharacterized membrane protein
MKKTRAFNERFSNFSEAFIAAVSMIAFGVLSFVSLVQTCHIDMYYSKDNNEHVEFLSDNILVNLVILLVLVALAVLFMRANVKRRTVRWVGAIAIVSSAVIGVWWVLASKAVPGADSSSIITAARQIVQGNTNILKESTYFYVFPFQTGFLLYAEGFLRLFGSNATTLFQLSNVLLVCVAYIAVLKLARVLFDDTRVELLTAILLGLCIQPMLLSTFLYGTIPGMTLAIWSIYFVAKAMKKKRLTQLIPAAILIALAVLLKKNFLIVLIAESIMLLIFALRNKRALALAFVALMAGLTMLLPTLVQKQYEIRADADFGKGTPQMAWLTTGFRESSLCSGWFNSYTTNVLRENGMDYDKALSQSKADLMEQLTMFASRPRYLASFMYKKVTSQWNEPAYQCIWSSAVGERSGEVSNFVISLGTGTASDAINAYFNQLMQFVYVSMTITLVVLCFHKEKRSEQRMIIPLILFGAALYHALFEAKSQYAIIYVPMMLPYAAFGIAYLHDWMAKKFFTRKNEAKAENDLETAQD